MKIPRKDKVDILEDSDADSEIAFCRYCQVNFNEHNPLGPRKDYEERDKDLWRQCTVCNKIFPVYEVKYEGKLRGLIDADQTANPFEQTKNAIVGFSNKDHRPSEKERLRKRIKEERDPEVRELLKQGIEIEDDYKWNYPEE